MSALREAAQQALEALIWTTGSADFGEGGQAREGALKLLFPSIAALRAALAQPDDWTRCHHCGQTMPPVPLGQAEPDLSRCPQCNGPADNGHDRSIPPNPYLCTKCMAEPVAWLQPKTRDGHLRPDLGYETCFKTDYGAFPVYTAPPKAEPVQTPVAWMSDSDVGFDRSEFGATPTVPLYTAPPKAKPALHQRVTYPELRRLHAQRDALLETLKYIDTEFRKHGRQHWPEAVRVRVAIKAVEGEDK